mmetsp:Transcript_45574/g.136211  ORF Transcript_45574/g.136211 Transcript_45574/m.136211 type:complete len:223 (-) Transcript_45574:147-815(-)
MAASTGVEPSPALLPSSAPASLRCCTAFAAPASAAMCRGVRPRQSGISREAPCQRRHRMTARWPLLAATARGTRPLWPRWSSTAASAAHRSTVTPALPWKLATSRGVTHLGLVGPGAPGGLSCAARSASRLASSSSSEGTSCERRISSTAERAWSNRLATSGSSRAAAECRQAGGPPAALGCGGAASDCGGPPGCPACGAGPAAWRTSGCSWRRLRSAASCS